MRKIKNTCALTLLLASVSLIIASNCPCGAKPPQPDQRELLAREEMMVMNLNRGPKSARFYMLESLKAIRLIQKDLDRARNQVDQVDAAYAKAKGRSDDRTMRTTVEQLRAAEQMAQQLEQQLQAAGEELKADVQTTLIK
jgi:hypothetical protein